MKSRKVCIIDYGMGNLGSLFNALNYLGTKVVVSDDLNVVSKSEILFLPGVDRLKKLWLK